MPLPNTYLGPAGFVGIGLETTQGTPVASSTYLELLDESLVYEPGIVLEKLLRGSRDTAFAPIIGEQSIKGDVHVPLYVDQGILLLAAAIGSDIAQTMGGSSGSASLSSNAAVGASSVSLAAQTTPALATGSYLELRQSSASAAGPANLSEIHLVTSVAGTGPYTINFTDSTLRYAYTSASSKAFAAAGSQATFTHMLQGDSPTVATYKSLTIEKALGRLTSLQYAGAVVSKASLALTTKEAAKAQYTLIAMAEAPISPTTPSLGTSAPLALANLSATLFGAADTSVSALSIDIDQGVKEFYTFNGSNLPAIVVPVERKITGKWTNILQSMTYFNDAIAGTTGAAAATLTQGVNSITVTLPKIVITKITSAIKVGDLIMYDAEFQAPYSDASGYSVQVTVVNGTYAPYC